MTSHSQGPLHDRVDASLSATKALSPIDRFDFPLAFNQVMPDDFEAPNGHVGIRFYDFALLGAASARVDRAASTAEELVVTFGALRLDGRYALTGKAAPVITLDTAGSLMEFEDPSAAGADPLEPMPPAQKEAMLNQARAERESLKNTENGQKLLGQYSAHNETYNTLFATNTPFRNSWVGDGATREMSEHTHVALREDDATVTIVNPPQEDRTFGTKKRTYNQNAWNQQLNLVTALIFSDPDFDPMDPNAKPNMDSPIIKAALAAMDFGKATEQTGNAKTVVVPMTGPEVHASVDKGKEPAPTDAKELENAVIQGMGGAQGAGAAAEARANNWRVLDEEDRSFIRRQAYLIAVDKVRQSRIQTVPIWEGACWAEMRGAEARIVLHPDGTPEEIALHLPAFEFDIDDSAWHGTVADVARDRLVEVSFARSFILDRIQTSLETALRTALAE